MTTREYYQKNKEKCKLKNKEYRQKNNEKERLRAKEYRKNHPEYFKQYSIKYNKKYYQKNKDFVKLKQKKYYRTNEEYCKEYSKEYYRINQDKIKKWKERNKEKIRLKGREYKQSNPDKGLKSKIKQLEKNAVPFKLPYYEYRRALMMWSQAVRKRDNKTCLVCGSIHKLNSHHIFGRTKYPELSLNPNNGITLCVPCHHQAHGINLMRKMV